MLGLERQHKAGQNGCVVEDDLGRGARRVSEETDILILVT